MGDSLHSSQQEIIIVFKILKILCDTRGEWGKRGEGKNKNVPPSSLTQADMSV